jgi:serine/threonine protein kinase
MSHDGKPEPEGSSPALFHAAHTIDLPMADGKGPAIGPYRILQLLGEGGFGSVYLAEQSEPIRRRVALKVIKLGMDTRQVIARFEQERQALAMMDHPAIAQVLDAGETDAGRPYFVMELVKGEPVTEYCDKHNLTIAARLELFAEVCSAVQHAHTKGIIHRDLKPSNILVSFEDGARAPRSSTSASPRRPAASSPRRRSSPSTAQLVGTPEYMSPEQAEGSLDIDTRTDVYALGVLLYELLTGTTPVRLPPPALRGLRRDPAHPARGRAAAPQHPPQPVGGDPLDGRRPAPHRAQEALGSCAASSTGS